MRAPIALFVYNRPWHTQQTVEALLKSEFAEESDLFVFSDAPKNSSSDEKVKAVRGFIRSTTGFKSLTIVERPHNLGLANSIIDGVTNLCNKYGQVIVLEDDLVTSPYFLKYMNDGLDYYRDEERVISIHGYIYPVKAKLPETFFLRGADCWGWATWKRGWDLFELDGEKLLAEIKAQKNIREFNYDGSYDLIGMLYSQIKGKVDSWAIRWYASAFINNKLTLYPGESLVLNIGNDGSGTHCGTTEMFNSSLIKHELNIAKIAIFESSDARSAIVDYFYASRITFFQRLKNKLTAVYKEWLM